MIVASCETLAENRWAVRIERVTGMQRTLLAVRNVGLESAHDAASAIIIALSHLVNHSLLFDRPEAGP